MKPALQRGLPRFEAPGAGPVREQDQNAEACGLGKLPYWSFTANQAWANLALLAMNLTSWIQLAMLPIGHPAGCWDVKRWRYRLYWMAGKLITSGRRTRLLIPETALESALLMELRERAHIGYRQWRQGHLAA